MQFPTSLQNTGELRDVSPQNCTPASGLTSRCSPERSDCTSKSAQSGWSSLKRVEKCIELPQMFLKQLSGVGSHLERHAEAECEKVLNRTDTSAPQNEGSTRPECESTHQ